MNSIDTEDVAPPAPPPLLCTIAVCSVCLEERREAVRFGCALGAHDVCCACACTHVRQESAPPSRAVRCAVCLANGVETPLRSLEALSELFAWSMRGPALLSARAFMRAGRLMENDAPREEPMSDAAPTVATPPTSGATTTPSTLAPGATTTSSQALAAAREAHFRACPGCGTGVQRSRGHHCHHISPGTGCTQCGTHFCYACLHVYPRNGPYNPCPNGCALYCSDACTCEDCPDCAPGGAAPCSDCDHDGRCWVCAPERRPRSLAWPCTQCRHVNAPADDACSQCAHARPSASRRRQADDDGAVEQRARNFDRREFSVGERVLDGARSAIIVRVDAADPLLPYLLCHDDDGAERWSGVTVLTRLRYAEGTRVRLSPDACATHNLAPRSEGVVARIARLAEPRDVYTVRVGLSGAAGVASFTVHERDVVSVETNGSAARAHPSISVGQRVRRLPGGETAIVTEARAPSGGETSYRLRYDDASVQRALNNGWVSSRQVERVVYAVGTRVRVVAHGAESSLVGQVGVIEQINTGARYNFLYFVGVAGQRPLMRESDVVEESAVAACAPTNESAQPGALAVGTRVRRATGTRAGVMCIDVPGGTGIDVPGSTGTIASHEPTRRRPYLVRTEATCDDEEPDVWWYARSELEQVPETAASSPSRAVQSPASARDGTRRTPGSSSDLGAAPRLAASIATATALAPLVIGMRVRARDALGIRVVNSPHVAGCLGATGATGCIQRVWTREREQMGVVVGDAEPRATHSYALSQLERVPLFDVGALVRCFRDDRLGTIEAVDSSFIPYLVRFDRDTNPQWCYECSVVATPRAIAAPTESVTPGAAPRFAVGQCVSATPSAYVDACLENFSCGYVGCVVAVERRVVAGTSVGVFYTVLCADDRSVYRECDLAPAYDLDQRVAPARFTVGDRVSARSSTTLAIPAERGGYVARVTLASDGVAARVCYKVFSDTDTEASAPVSLGVYDESMLELVPGHDAVGNFAVGMVVSIVSEREPVRGCIARKGARSAAPCTPAPALYFVRYHDSPPTEHETKAAGWHCAAELLREDWAPRLRVGARVRVGASGVEGVIVADDGSTRPYHVRSALDNAWLGRSQIELVQALRVGARVVRGPAWVRGDQDGGIGSVGRVACELEPATGTSTTVARYVVRWPNQPESSPRPASLAYDPANVSACEIVPLRE